MKKKRLKGKWIYTAPLLEAHTQGAQVRITQFYLQMTPYLPYLVSVHQVTPPLTDVADIQLQPTAHLSTLKGWKAKLALLPTSGANGRAILRDSHISCRHGLHLFVSQMLSNQGYCVLLCCLLTVFFYNFLMAFVRLSLNCIVIVIVKS